MKNYIKPELSLILFKQFDVITASDGTTENFGSIEDLLGDSWSDD